MSKDGDIMRAAHIPTFSCIIELGANMITATITSYNRFKLLEICIHTLLQQNIDLIDKIIIGEDSGDIAMKNKIENLIAAYPNNKIELQFNAVPLTQPGNISQLYSAVQTPYILHIEDDYRFDGTNKNFIQNSIDILEERNDINAVWIRCLDNYRDSHNTPDARVFFGTLNQTKSGVQYREFTITSIQLSWMPNIHRLADYKKFFPNGYLPLIHSGAKGSHAEGQCGKTVEYQYKSSTLENGVARTYDHFANSTYH